MDYKDTLNLPRTGFPMKADLVTREPERVGRWESAQLYQRLREARAGAPKYVLHDGPLFANGDIHVGNALNKVLKDVAVRFKSLRGFDTPMVPGWDCHGLPVEFKVTQEMRKAGDTSTDPVNLRKACEAYARRFIDIQREQWKRLGALGDWPNPYLTLDREYEANELRLFADIVEQGFVYRGKKPIYWSIPCRTALAEAEVEYQDHVSQSVYVKFPVVGHPDTFIVIWTTTPWTLPANLAVAFNSTFQYSFVRVPAGAGADRAATFIVSAPLLAVVAEKCGWTGFEIVRTVNGDELQELTYQHPFCNRTGRLHRGDHFVDNTTGTGFVHIAPGHGQEDYGVGRLAGLPIYSPVDDDGCLAYTNDLPREQQMPAEMVGKAILEKHGKSDANEAVLHELRLRHALLHQENYHHSYPHCWRSKTPVIFRAMDQWFIKIDHEIDGKAFRDLAFEAIGRVQWIPDWGRSRIEGAVKSRPDWCISRQRSWGVPIPAFYDEDGNAILDAQIVRRTADLFAQHGSNIWFEKTAAALWKLVRPADWQGETPTAKSNDTLDVWIDSGSSSRAVLQSRPELVKPLLREVKAGEDAGFAKVHLADFPNTFILVPCGSAQTLPDSLVVAFDQGAFFSLFRAGPDFFIAHGLSVGALVQSCGLPGYELVRTVHVEELASLRLRHPDIDRPMRLLAAPATGIAEARESGFWFADWKSDLYLEGSDQHRGWFQSSLLLALAGGGAPPFKTVLTHGFIVDADREKISKSKQGQEGGYVKPQTAERYVKDYGADVLRLWIASQDFRNDVVVSEERLKKVGETYRMLRNTLRYQLSNLYDFDSTRHTVPEAELTGLDRWILGEFARLEADVMRSYETMEFHVIYQRVSQFAAVELSAIYHDVVKDRLYTDPANSRRRRSTQTALHRLVTGLCQLMAPILAFTADEAWECIPGKAESSVQLSRWEPLVFDLSETESVEWKGLFGLREAALPHLEQARQAKRIGKALEAKVTISGSESALGAAVHQPEILRELLNVSQLALKLEPGATTPVFGIDKAEGQKCERCWHWESDVGGHAGHPTICGRCTQAVLAETAG